MGIGSFAGVKWQGRRVDQPPQSSAEVKERVELYLCCLFGPSWPVVGWNVTFTFTYLLHSVFNCIDQIQRLCVTFSNILIYHVCGRRLLASHCRLPLVGCPHLLIRYICTCPAYVHVIEPIRKQRSLCAVVTGIIVPKYNCGGRYFFFCIGI